MIEHVVVLAAGRGTRMGSLTLSRPKALLPIVGRPMVARVLDGFFEAGARRFTVVVDGDGVEDWLGAHWRAGTELAFVAQGVQRGTSAALVAARDTIEGPFVLTSCDNLISGELAAGLLRHFEERPGDVAVVAVIDRPQDIRESAAVWLDARGRVTRMVEKPGEEVGAALLAMSVFGFSPRVLDYLPDVDVSSRGERELTSAIQAMVDGGLPVGHVMADWRCHVTNPRDLLAANLHFLEDGRWATIHSELAEGVRVEPPVRIDERVRVASGAVIGPRAYLESGTVVGEGARVRDAVVLGCVIGAGQVVANEVVAGDR